MKTDKTFALGTWEIHLQTPEEQKYILENMKSVCTYIDTAIDYNNDYLLTETIPLNYKMITKIAPCHYPYYDFFVDNHLKCLKRDKIDIMLIHSSRGHWIPLAERMEKDPRFIEVGVSNFNIEELEMYKTVTGHYPKYNEFETNPFYTELDTIEFCKEHNIKIIAYGIFGGKYNAMKNIAELSIPYLVKYASHFADILILKPESFRQTNEILDVIQNYDFDDGNKIKPANNNIDDKAIVPMRYDAKDIVKCFNHCQTYYNACGKNHDIYYSGTVPIENIPSFEMLGDFMTYIRYMYRQRYDGTPVYDYDFLIGDDGHHYKIDIYDNFDRITKVNKTNKYHVYKLIK